MAQCMLDPGCSIPDASLHVLFRVAQAGAWKQSNEHLSKSLSARLNMLKVCVPVCRHPRAYRGAGADER